MEEKNLKNPTENAKHPTRVWLENFWYHYKIHTLVAVFVVVALTVILTQMADREEYDVHVVYAGTHHISGSGQNGDIAPHVAMVGSLKKVAGDYNEDGNVNVNLLTYHIYTAKEADEYLEKNPDKSLNEVKMRDERSNLSSNLLFGEYYVYFLSEGLYNEYYEQYEGELFRPLVPFAKEGYSGYEYALGGRGVYLRSLPLKDQPVLADLPDDTVVCLRAVSEVSDAFGQHNEDMYEASCDVMRRILSFGISN
jgi:hypothetical protein